MSVEVPPGWQAARIEHRYSLTAKPPPSERPLMGLARRIRAQALRSIGDQTLEGSPEWPFDRP